MNEVSNMGEGDQHFNRALKLAQQKTTKDIKAIVAKMRPLPSSWQKGKSGTNEYYKFMKTMKTDEDRARVKRMLDDFDGRILKRLNRSIKLHKSLSPWHEIDFKSYGSPANDLKAFKHQLLSE